MAKPRFEPLRIRKLADTESEQRVRLMVLRKAPMSRESVLAALGEADAEAETITLPNMAFTENMVERILFNPATPGFEHEPWPLAGIAIEGEAPQRARIATSWVDDALRDSGERDDPWIELVNERIVHKPGGPESEPWRLTHTFRHADELVLHTVDGDVRYRVTRQPDKYDGGPENGTGKPTEAAGDPDTSVDWFYEVELVS